MLLIFWRMTVMQIYDFRDCAEDGMVVGRSIKPFLREKNHED
jgi:hypothetical protein